MWYSYGRKTIKKDVLTVKKHKNVLRACRALLFTLLLLPAGALMSFAAEEKEPASFLTVLGNNFWYILLVIAFGAGIILVSKWSKKINARDEQFKAEYEEYKAEHPEEFADKEAQTPDPAENDGEAAEEPSDPSAEADKEPEEQ